MKQLRAFATGVLLFAVVLVGVLGIVWAAGAQYADAPEASTEVTNETVVADIGNETTVDAPSYALDFVDNETITNSSGVTLTEGTDYEWNTSTGAITWYDTSSVDDGEQMAADYAYNAKTSEARSLKQIADVQLLVILPTGVLIVAAMSVAGLAAGAVALFRTRRRGRGSTSITRR